MKKHLILSTAAVLFSTLFYDQWFGLNMLLFAIVAIGVTMVFQPKNWRHTSFILGSGGYLFSAIFVFTAHSDLSIFTYFIAFIGFAGSISGKGNAIYVQLFNGMYQAVLGATHSLIHRDPKQPRAREKYNIGFILFTTLIVALVLIIFLNLYGTANPIFGQWLSAIDISFINFPWLILSAMGYFLLLNLTATSELDFMTQADRTAPLFLKTQEISQAQLPLVKKENTLGTALLAVLNGLILLYICADVLYLSQNPLQDAAMLSRTVHEGVNALIASIVIAITLILILFRGNLNFYNKNKRLQTLTSIWIALNVLIIILTAYKNFLYSTGFGLTHKRIGVFIYLFICISGLVTTYFKIARKRKLLFMIKANTRVAFIVLILMGSFNWNRTITKFNLSTLQNPDIQYLLHLAPDNGDLLHAFAKANPSKIPFPKRINIAYANWQSQLDSETWQSKTLLGILYSKKQ